MATSFSGGGNRGEPPIMGKLVNFITCESSAPFFVIYSRVRTHAVLVIGLYMFRTVYAKTVRVNWTCALQKT